MESYILGTYKVPRVSILKIFQNNPSLDLIQSTYIKVFYVNFINTNDKYSEVKY